MLRTTLTISINFVFVFVFVCIFTFMLQEAGVPSYLTQSTIDMNKLVLILHDLAKNAVFCGKKDKMELHYHLDGNETKVLTQFQKIEI